MNTLSGQAAAEDKKDEKLAGTAPVKAGVAQDAARAILEKMRAGRRK